jgi:hypothetical protein
MIVSWNLTLQLFGFGLGAKPKHRWLSYNTAGWTARLVVGLGALVEMGVAFPGGPFGAVPNFGWNSRQ